MVHQPLIFCPNVTSQEGKYAYRMLIYDSHVNTELRVAMNATYWLAEDALEFRELDALACLHVMEHHLLARRQWPFGHACIANTVLSLALPCGARALRVACTWSTSEKSGAFSPTFKFFITDPLDVRTRSGAGLGAIRVNAPLMLGAKAEATIFSIFNA